MFFFVAILSSSTLHHAAAVQLPSEEERLRCEAESGVLVEVSLTVNVLQGDYSQKPTQETERDRKQSIVACLPSSCVALETESCREVRNQVLKSLSETKMEDVSSSPQESTSLHSKMPAQSEKEFNLVEESSMPEQDLWLVDGVTDVWNIDLRAAYHRIHYNKHDFVPSTSPEHLRAIIVGTHGPLSVLIAEHVQAAVDSSETDIGLYGQCYLCTEIPACRETFRRSLADRGCDWFHSANRADMRKLLQEVKEAAADIVVRQSFLHVAVCLGVLLCSFLFEALPESVQRIQVLCMNPVQGIPEAFVPTLMHVLSNRAARGEVFTTNAITSALVAYYVDGLMLGNRESDKSLLFSDSLWNVKALSLFPQHLHQIGSRGIWSSDNRDLLYARSFILLHDPICGAFVEALQKSWSYGVREHPTHWDFSKEAEVEALLTYRAVVYMPEHPYKNLFNDFFAMSLPICVPGIGFLSRLWPQVRHVDIDATYDGWFDRSISRVRSTHISEAVPEPFDLDVDGRTKVHFWLHLADYYNFPGVHVFIGLADLLEQLVSGDLTNSRKLMQQHYQGRRALAIAAFQHAIGKLSHVPLAPVTLTTLEPEIAPVAKAGEPLGSALLAWKRGRGAGQPLGACINTSPMVARQDAQEVAGWIVRIGGRSQYPPVIRLQVWRPIRVGWMRGDQASTFQLIGENRAILYSAKRGAGAIRHVHVSEQSRIVMKPGDVIAWSSECALCKVFRGRGWWKSARSYARMRRPALASNHSQSQLCLDWYANQCRFWPSRKVCSFHRVMSTPDVQVEATLRDIQFDQFPTAIYSRPFLSIAFELTFESATFAVWFVEHANQIIQEVPPSSWTFFVCPPQLNDIDQKTLYYNHWRSLVTMFHVAVGVSPNCYSGDQQLVMQAAEDFLLEVVPHTPWLVLSNDSPEDLQRARALAESSPSGSGWALSAVIVLPDQQSSCVNTYKEHLVFDSLSACTYIIDQEIIWPKQMLLSNISPHLHNRNVWALQVFSCLNCFDILEVEPLRTLNELLGCAKRSILPGRYRSAIDMALLAAVKPALNLDRSLDNSTTYEEFMTLRQNLSSLDLGIFEDKIRLRRELLQNLGVEHTPTYYMSNTDNNILPHIANRTSYVVKPTHMTESEHVFIVNHGRHVFDVRFDGSKLAIAGATANATLIQEKLSSAWSKTAYQWECNAVVSAKPGVIVEKLVFATMDPGAPDMQRVEEARFHVVWGTVVAAEWAVDKRGSTVFSLHVDHVGRLSLSTDGMWTEGIWIQSFLRDPDGWAENVARCLPFLERMARRVAIGAGADHLRVDILVEGSCDRFYVSEVELFPAVPFPPATMEIIERRWRYGYGIE